MQHFKVDGATLAYTIQEPEAEPGENVILFHPGFVADACATLIGEPALAGQRLINYHRRGYGESSRVAGVVPFEQQADDVLALMDHLGVDKAHLVGHSLGGCIAVQVALSEPERVATLTLLEAPLGFALSPASAQLFGGVIQAAYGCYGAGDLDGAADTWLSIPFGPGYRAIMEERLPGSVRRMIADTPAVFESEAPAMQMWQVGPDAIRRITQPVLSVYHSLPGLSFFEEVDRALVDLLPQTESCRCDDVTHLLQIQNPGAIAAVLADFLVRHPITQVRALP